MFSFFSKKNIYLDNSSFTYLREKSYKRILKIFSMQKKALLANALSFHHIGTKTKSRLEENRDKIASLYDMDSNNVLFTSSATESNNLSLKNFVLDKLIKGKNIKDMHFIVNRNDHSSLSNEMFFYEKLGADITYLDEFDLLTPQVIKNELKENTIYVSFSFVNSQNGILQPVREIAKVIKKENEKIYIHCDAAQGAKYFKISPEILLCDSVSISSPKIGGPQGIGLLLVKNYDEISGILGKKDKYSLRTSTPALALIEGLTEALVETLKNIKRDRGNVEEKRNYLIKLVKQNFKDTTIPPLKKKLELLNENDLSKIAPHMLVVSFENINHEYLSNLLSKDAVFVAVGPSCSIIDKNKLRISLTSTTTKKDLRFLIKSLIKNLAFCRLS